MFFFICLYLIHRSSLKIIRLTNNKLGWCIYNFNVFILYDEFRVHESHWSFRIPLARFNYNFLREKILTYSNLQLQPCTWTHSVKYVSYQTL